MANRWTEEQLQAINKTGSNIIVSAGAGSGKTEVLSERVIEKLRNGVHINNLLVLTFTNAAASEMKGRIREKIINDSKLSEERKQEEISLIDSSYITTFDSFALSIVKKYHYILNITSKVSITEEALITIKTEELLDEVLDEFYLKKDDSFLNFMNDFCLKSDDSIKKMITSIFKNILLKNDVLKFLDSIEDYFTEDMINSYIDDYLKILNTKQEEVKNILRELSLGFDSTYMEKLYNVLSNFLNAKTYDEIKKSLDFRLPAVPRNTEEELKNLKGTLKDVLDEVKNLTYYEDIDTIKKEILDTKENTKVFRDILKSLYLKLEKYKRDEDLYDFNDVFHFAIKLVLENEDVRSELKNNFHEILIDEYQDTSDLQELFISSIENNNVYMVGDIKQSIYRFRNANPKIFKDKYDKYSKGEGGIKIDLNKNFRSRREVLDNINLVFNKIMSLDIGGADYTTSHQMLFGNKTYEEEGKTNQNYNFKIKTYEKSDGFDNSVEEAFIIGRDIKKKVDDKYQVYKAGSSNTRDAKYSDFTILLDRSSDFALYKKVLDYLEIPCTISKDESLTGEDDILVIKNIFKLISLISKKKYNSEFRYSFVSIARSFLFNLSDEEIFSYFVDNNFKDSDIYVKCFKISKKIEEKTLSEILEEIIDEFCYEEKLITTTDIKLKRTRLEYIMKFVSDFASLGKTLDDVLDYLDTVLKSEIRLNFSTETEDNNSVTIMTIHKSKGLGFPVCYFAGFKKSFNFSELRERIIYNKKYGIILPKVDDFYKPTILKTLAMRKNIEEEISEKIRLLYVALTRVKEEMIIVCPTFEKYQNDTTISTQLKYKSFYDILESISIPLDKYTEVVESNATMDFQNTTLTNILKVKDYDNFTVKEINYTKEELKDVRYSKESMTLYSKDDKKKLEKGTSIHKIFEMLDFKNPNLENINKSERQLVERFLNSKIIKENINGKFYHEYEFIKSSGSDISHGIIDLMIENDNNIIIIDYKLKDTEDKHYIDQLNGYKNAIEEKTKKDVSTYLYSIIDNKFKEV